MKKVLMIILGILTIVSGIILIANPEMSLPLTGGLMAAGLCMFSITALLIWFEKREEDGKGDIFTLIMVILGFIFSLMFASNLVAQILSANLLFYMELIFMIAAGIILIVDAFRTRKLKEAKSPALRDIGASWGWMLAAGILLIIAGVFALCHPLGGAIVNGVYMGIEMLVAGIAVIVWAIRA